MTDVESLSRISKAKATLSWSMVFDISSAVSVVTFIAISEFGWMDGWVTKRGFYCDDRSIQRPYIGDTISAKVIILGGLLPLILIWLTEALFYLPGVLELSKSGTTKTRLSHSWYESWHLFKKYGRGLIIQLILVDVIKIYSGEHRPHFLDTCKPNVVCEGSEYVSTYICTNTNERSYFVRDASKSFPSGHSSISVYGAIFMIWYLQKRIPKLQSTMALPLCQFLISLWGILCPISRVVDNRHHWWDVLAGFLIGVITAVLTCFCSCHNFDQTKLHADHSTYKCQDIKLIGSSSHGKEDNGLNNIVHST